MSNPSKDSFPPPIPTSGVRRSAGGGVPAPPSTPPAGGPGRGRGPAFYPPDPSSAPTHAQRGIAPPAAADELLSRRSIHLVQQSWAKVMPISDAAATLFYDRLFELDPSLRALFKSDMADQKRKLMQTLAVAVDGLTDLKRLVPVLQSLGARHAGYMVTERHYDTVGEALLWTLREGLGDGFTGEIEAAWGEVYGLVADVMKKAASSDHRPMSSRAPAAPTRPSAPAPPAPFPPGAPPSSRSAPPLPGRAAAPPPGPALLDLRTIDVVQQSWARVMPISDAAAALFYDRLFELDPSVRALFKSDMADQKRKLMQTLAVAVDGLRDLNRLVPVLQALGARHAGYMVTERHYDLVGEALLWTLREGLGAGYTGEVEAAWKKVYGLVADVMKKAAAAHAGAGAGLELAGAPPAGAPRALAAPRAPLLDEDAATLHYDLSAGGAADPPAPAPVARVASAPLPAAGGAPVPAAVAAAQARIGALLPGQDATLSVHVKLDTPLVVQLPATATHGAEPAAQGPLAPALALALVCVAASTGVAMLGPKSESAPYGIPLLILVLTLAAFLLGHLWSGRRPPAGDDQGRPGPPWGRRS